MAPKQLGREANVTINGVELGHGGSMTLRVAVTSFIESLNEPERMSLLDEIGPLYLKTASMLERLLIYGKELKPYNEMNDRNDLGPVGQELDVHGRCKKCGATPRQPGFTIGSCLCPGTTTFYLETFALRESHMIDPDGCGTWMTGLDSFLARVRKRVTNVISRSERSQEGIKYSVLVGDPEPAGWESQDPKEIWTCLVKFKPLEPSPTVACVDAAREQTRIVGEIWKRYGVNAVD